MSNRNRYVFRMETLEERQMMAADAGMAAKHGSDASKGYEPYPSHEIIAQHDPGLIYLTSRGDLVARGTEGNDRIRIALKDDDPNAVVVFVQDLETLDMREREVYQISEFSRFYAAGFGGDDEVLNDTPIASTLEGGQGDDLIRGGLANDVIFGDDGDDVLFGGDGNDELRGGRGNDDLRGDAGQDKLYGDKGLDGLFGGQDGDDLYGGEGPDRFLVQPGDVVHGPANEDALLTMKNSQGLVKFTHKSGSFEYEGKSWTDDEIQQVDSALRAMHLRVGNTSLLKTASGSDMTLIRGGNSSISNASATNVGNFDQPAIIFFKGTFNDGLTWTRQVVFHEFAHNLDEQDENPAVDEFRKLSGWTQVKPTNPFGPEYTSSGDKQWWYLTGSEFVRDYAKTNPYEDFASTFAAYFMTETGQSFKNGSGFGDPDVAAPKKMKFMMEMMNAMTTQDNLT